MLRIAICQKLLRRYRVPVYDLLGSQDDIDLTLFAQLDRASVGAWTGEAHRFRLVESPSRSLRWLPGSLQHQEAQLEAATCGRFDLVILPWDIHYLSTVWPITGGRRSRRTRIALWGHGYSKRPGRWRDRLRQALGRRADAVLLYSDSTAEAMVARGMARERIFVARNAIDQTPIQAARRHWEKRPEKLRAFREQHGLDPAQTVLFVSRLLPENRADQLVEGLARIAETHAQARLVIVGEGPARSCLETLVARRGLGRRVTFTGAIFDDMALAPWMLSATLLGYPRNLGLTLLHAFGFGLPVVTSDAPGAHGPEIDALENGVNGLLFQEGSIDSMVACWRQIMDAPEYRAELSRAALKAVLERYTLPNMVQGFLDLTSIVDSRSRSVVATGAAT